MNLGVIEGSCVRAENRQWGAGDVAFRCGPTLGGGERIAPNAGPQLAVPALNAGEVVVKINWSPAVAWRKTVELSRR